MAVVSEDLHPTKAPDAYPGLGGSGSARPLDPGDTTGPAVLDLGFARLDVERTKRTGIPEVVYAEGKTPQQVVDCLAGLLDRGQTALATRVGEASVEAIRQRWPDADIDSVARCARVPGVPDAAQEGGVPALIGSVVVVSAGTSDASVAAEASFIAQALGAEVTRIEDVGVAGLHRLLAVRAELEAADIVIVVAGMDGALASAVGGLVSTPVVAVPTSVGYGAAFEGLAALLTMLTSCAPGVVVTNIDNGFGAATFAAKVLRRRQP
ncbi:MAG: nickel pincer cofactor biosynthesis protein LarB [Geodermatophilaceae bacterium]|nr:nickel pincer cofactor biosynthesis protein LarB [Geodermatophilaceae bacterium]